VKIGEADGVSGTGGSTVALDRDGRVYVANNQGLFRVQDQAVRAQRFGLEDGLPSLTTTDMLADSDGRLWLATPNGVARFMPPAQRQPTPPDPVFSEVRAGGLPIELPLLGVSQVGPIELAAERSTLEVGVTATSIESGEQLRYQYRIDGLESEFGAASEHTNRLYPSLSPGTYRTRPAGARPVVAARLVRCRPHVDAGRDWLSVSSTAAPARSDARADAIAHRHRPAR
jgi:hypothetical protein